MLKRTLWMIGLLVLIGTAPAGAQSLRADGTVTEISGDRVVVERDTSVSVTENSEGQVFATTRLGDDEQKILAAALRVKVVSGAIVVGQIAARSNLVDVGVGQKVSFSSEMPKASMPGTVVVQSTPSEAQVELVSLATPGQSARQLGTTPVRQSVAPGRYRVRVTKDKYRTATQTVQVRAGGKRTVKSSLEARTGTLVVRPTPDTAAVLVDGQPVGTGAVQETLEVGRHEVTVNAEGYTSTTTSVTVDGESTRTLTPTLDRKRGTLTVNTTPSGATVVLDGSEVGSTPMDKEVPVGSHEVTVRKQGYVTDTRSIVVQNGASTQVSVDLQVPIEVDLAAAKGPVQDAQMRRDGRNLVVGYDLTGSEDEYEVVLQLSTDGGETYKTIEKALSGDLGEEIAPGADKEIRWTALETYPNGIHGGSYQIRIRAEEAFQAGGVTIQVMSPSEEVGEFGGLTLGWTGESSYVMGAYNGATESVGFRAGPVWRQGWFSLQLISGLSYGDGLSWQVGSGLHVGGSLYVGAEVLYMSEFDGGETAGAFLTIGVSL